MHGRGDFIAHSNYTLSSARKFVKPYGLIVSSVSVAALHAMFDSSAAEWPSHEIHLPPIRMIQVEFFRRSQLRSPPVTVKISLLLTGSVACCISKERAPSLLLPSSDVAGKDEGPTLAMKSWVLSRLPRRGCCCKGEWKD